MKRLWLEKYEIDVRPTNLTMTFDNWEAEGAWQVFKIGDTFAIGGCVYEVCDVENQSHTSERVGESKLTVYLRSVQNGGCNG